jgi:septal ring factor EnvC (AmiA/AmiB activator)
VAANATEALKVREERVFDETVAVSNLTPNLISDWVQNQALSGAARQQLDQILQKKGEIARVDAQIKQTQADMAAITQDQDRQRRNIESLRNVAGQQEQVQNYAKQLAAGEAKLVGLRDNESEQRRRKAGLEGELNSLLDKMQF